MKDKEGKVDLYRNQQGSSQRNWLLARPDVNQMMPFKPSAAKGQQFDSHNLKLTQTVISQESV